MKLGELILVFLSLSSGSVAAKKKQNKPKTEETFLLLNSVRNKLINRILSVDERAGDMVTDYTPDEGQSEPDYFLINSTCPWKFVRVYNPKRIPETTIEAVCESDQCRLPVNRADHAEKMKLQNPTNVAKHRCQPVMYYRWVKVLKTKKSPGKGKSSNGKKSSSANKYTDRLLPITVGCTCVDTPRISLEK